jgi:Spy/CpxP family protein refolding chaperone
MLRSLTIFFICLLFNTSGFAQGKGSQSGGHRERIEAQKISYITQQLQLSPQEAQLFWPLYNEMQDKRHALNKERKQLMKKIRAEESSLSEAQISKLSDQVVDLLVKNAELQRDYHHQFKKVLPPLKVLKLYQSERQFQGMLLHRLKEGPHRRRGR